MIWRIKDKEEIVKTCFALFPKKIGDCWVWLQPYYKTYTLYYCGIYSGYKEHLFIYKDDAEQYVRDKNL